MPGLHRVHEPVTRLEFLDSYDAASSIGTQEPVDETLAYKPRIGKQKTW